MSVAIDTTIDLALVVTLIGVLITYFGKLIIRAKKEVCRDVTSEVLEGLFFIMYYLVFPISILYLIIKSINTLINIIPILIVLINTILIFIILWEIKEEKSNLLFTIINGVFALLSIFSVYFIIITNTNIIFIMVSSMFLFLILTLSAIVYANYTNKKINKHKKKIVADTIIYLSNNKKINGKIKRIGNEFIEIFDTEKNKHFKINKSYILKLEEI